MWYLLLCVSLSILAADLITSDIIDDHEEPEE